VSSLVVLAFAGTSSEVELIGDDTTGALPLPLAGEGGVGVPPWAQAQWKQLPPPAALCERVDLPRKRER
jgi:hypothetical protein